VKRILKDDSPTIKGAFFEEGTEDEYNEYIEDEDRGWKGFKKRLFNLGKDDDKTNREQAVSEGGE